MILLIIYSLLIVTAFSMPKSRKLAIIISLFLIFVYSFGQSKGDYQVFKWIYESFPSGEFNIHNCTWEIGFATIAWICSMAGISFVGFRLIVGVFICLSLYKIFFKLTDNVALSLALYGIFPFFIWSAAMRSGVATVFVLYAFKILIDNNLKRNWKTFVYLLIAILFHTSSIMFLFFAIFYNNRIKIKRGAVAIALAISLLFAVLLFYTNIPYMVVSHFTDNVKTLTWFIKGNGTLNTNGIIVIVGTVMLVFILSRYNLTIGNKLYNKKCIQRSELDLIDLSYHLALFMIVLIPFMGFSSPFLRILYVSLGIIIPATLMSDNRCYDNYIITGAMQDKDRKNTILLRKNWLFLVGVLLICKLQYDLVYIQAGQPLFVEFIGFKLAL